MRQLTTAAVRRGIVLLLLVAGARSPLAAQILLRSSSVQEMELPAGGRRYTGTIVIANADSQPRAAKVYLTDYAFSADGTNDFGAPGHLPRSSATWVTLPTSRVIVPGMSSASVQYTVTVPERDSLDRPLAGTYWTMAWVEGEGEPGGQAAFARGKQTVSLRPVLRYGTEIVTHIGPAQHRDVSIGTPSIARDSAGTSVAVVLTGTGTHGFRPTVLVEIYDSTGTVVARDERTRGLVFPGTSFTHRVAGAPLRAGAYTLSVVVDTGEEEVAARQQHVVLPR